MDERAIQVTLSSRFGSGARVTGVAELAGDASTRRYFRIRMAPGSPVASLVMMRYPDRASPGEELPFLNVHRYLRKAGVPVPEIFLSVPEENLLFLEDAGDTTLEEVVNSATSADQYLPHYERCTEVLVRIQGDGTRALDGRAIPSRLAFDVGKFAGEIDFFFENAVRGYGGIALSDKEERAIEDQFLPFLEELAGLPRVLAHRDYHSRNIMVVPGGKEQGAPGLRILDFQDARMGNVFYDLASLLRDSYVTLSGKLADHLCYVYRHAATVDLKRMAGDRASFAYHLDLSALQRNVKAIGTFGNQAHNLGKELYLRFIPPTVSHLKENFERNPCMKPLARKLLPILSALAGKASSGTPS